VNFFQKIKKNQTNQHTKTNTRNTYHRFTSCTQSLQQQQQQQEEEERTSLIIIMFKKKPFAKAVQSKSDNPRLFFVGLVCVILLYIYRALLLSSSSSKSKKKKKKEEMVVVDKTRKISAEEVRKHNSVDDLWIIIDKKVYDVTEYAEEHPGGVAAIAKNAGGDASKGFRGPQHPSRVFDIVDDYMIGVLEEKK
jgi:cytochrome b involved in lipid metabolism